MLNEIHCTIYLMDCLALNMEMFNLIKKVLNIKMLKTALEVNSIKYGMDSILKA
jgi:hypothetical protein